MKLRIDGRELPELFAEDIRLRESAEAEKHLGMELGETASSSLMLVAFVSIRRDDPDKHPVDVANDVLELPWSAFVDEESSRPPAEGLADEALESPPTIGTQPLEASG